MGLFSDYHGIKWKNIIILIVLIAVLVGGLLFVVQAGILKDPSSTIQNLGKYLRTGISWGKTFFISLIVVLPILVYGFMGIFEKTTTGIWAAALMMLIFGSISSLNTALWWAWIINAGLIIAATKKEAKKIIKHHEAWLIFGISSMIIAPFGSVVSLKPSVAWIYLAFTGMIGTEIMTHKNKEGLTVWNTIRNKWTSTTEKIMDWVGGIFNYMDVQLKLVEENTKSAKEGIDAADKVWNAVSTGKEEEASDSFEVLKESFKKIAEQETIVAEKGKGVGNKVAKIMEETKQSAEKVKSNAATDPGFAETKAGRVHTHIVEASTELLNLINEKKDWSILFDEMKKNENSQHSFSRFAKELRSLKDDVLSGIAKKLGKKSKNIGPEDFLRMMRKAKNRIEKIRNKAKEATKIVEEVREKDKKIRAWAQKIDEKFIEIENNQERVEEYDKEARARCIAALKDIDKLAKKEMDKDERLKRLAEMYETLKWIVKYLPEKEKAMGMIKEKVKEIKKSENNANSLIDESAQASYEVEKINAMLGSGEAE